MQTTVKISLADVQTGADKEIEMRRLAVCGECAGTGLMPGTHMSRCETCGGTGQLRSQHRSFLGTFISATACPECDGSGQVITEPCPSCKGEGRRWLEEKLQVSVPPGVERGDHLRLRDKGEGGVRGGPSGDLYVAVDIERHQLFEREGTCLKTGVDIEMEQAALGCEVQVPTLDGEHKLKVPAGTQPGKTLRVKGKGIPQRGGGRKGDILVTVNVVVPTRLTTEQKNLLERYKDSRKGKVGR